MTVPLNSAIYDGQVRHRRFEPVEREFRYRIFMVYLDLDELSDVVSMHPLWSTRPRSPARFRRDDYLGPPGTSIKDSVHDLVESRTGRRPRGPVRMLTHLRYWGVCFNPVTFYYCFDPAGDRVETVLAEVTNTPWGDQHTYLIDRPGRAGTLNAEVAKRMHVSPLMGMDQRYELVFGQPGRTLSVHMESREGEVTHLDATLRLARLELSRPLMGRLLFTRIPMPAKVLGGIHLEAARTWFAGVPYRPRPEKDGREDLPNQGKHEMLCPVEVSGFRPGSGHRRSGH